jgi:hypothetical protein
MKNVLGNIWFRKTQRDAGLTPWPIAISSSGG